MHRIPLPVALLVAALVLGLLLPLQDAIIERQKVEDIHDVSPLEAVEPGQFVGTVLIGGFRMLAIDALWYRYLDRFDERDYFEMRALASLITKLQPRFEEVWVFHGWMLAYNVAATETDPEARWKWVHQGIEVLQEGRRRNPRSWRVAFQTGWTYFHKCVVDETEFARYASKRFAESPAINPEGKSAIEMAHEEFDHAASIDGHSVACDFRALQTLEWLLAMAADVEELARWKTVADARHAHILEVHRARVSSQYLRAWKDQIDLVHDRRAEQLRAEDGGGS